MASPYVGEIRCFGFQFAPLGWAACNGQLIAIGANTALFSVIGTTYGGDGVTTFGLPNLQGRIPMHWGNGPGGFNTVIGEVQGATTVTLTTTQIPIIGPMRRSITRSEALRLQGFPPDFELPSSREFAFQALGNAVHVGVATEVAARCDYDLPFDEQAVQRNRAAVGRAGRNRGTLEHQSAEVVRTNADSIKHAAFSLTRAA